MSTSSQERVLVGGLRGRQRWTPREDSALRLAVQKALAENNPVNWHEVAASIPGRTNKDCRKRYHYKLATNIRKGAWTKIEDHKLLSAVRKHGCKWTRVALEVGSRNGDQCSKRWRDSLNPQIDHSPWSSEEDERLLERVKVEGRNWSRITDTSFPHRAALSLKNRHALLLRRAGTPPIPDHSGNPDNSEDDYLDDDVAMLELQSEAGTQLDGKICSDDSDSHSQNHASPSAISTTSLDANNDADYFNDFNFDFSLAGSSASASTSAPSIGPPTPSVTNNNNNISPVTTLLDPRLLEADFNDLNNLFTRSDNLFGSSLIDNALEKSDDVIYASIEAGIAAGAPAVTRQYPTQPPDQPYPQPPPHIQPQTHFPQDPAATTSMELHSNASTKQFTFTATSDSLRMGDVFKHLCDFSNSMMAKGLVTDVSLSTH